MARIYDPLGFAKKLDIPEPTVNSTMATQPKPIEQLPKGDWRENPLPLEDFVHSPNHLSGDWERFLFPKQQEDIENFLGKDPKRVLSDNPETDYSQAFFMWGKGCLGKNEKLTDYRTGQTLTVAEWEQKAVPLVLPSWDGEKVVLKPTSPVYKKGRDKLYRVRLKDGRKFSATAKHKILTDAGFQEVGALGQDSQIFTISPLYTEIESVKSIGEGDFYDLTVPETGNYFDSKKLCHHNSGKDQCVSYVQAWILHILLCLNNPQEYLGIANGDSIDILVIGYNEHQAKEVYFRKFKNLLNQWQWLRDKIDELVPDIGAENWLKEGSQFRGAYKVEFPNAIRCWSLPSTPNSGEGKNPVFWVLDELAAFSSPTRINQAKEIHNMVTSSARSRYGNQWKGFAISYPRHKEDYMMQMVNLAETGQAQDIYWSRRPTWEVNPNATRESLEPDFQRDPEGSAMRYGCEPPAAAAAYFRSPELIILHAWGVPEKLLKEAKPDLAQAELEKIANRGQNPIAETDGKGDIVLDHRGFPKLKAWFLPESSETQYYCHLDPGANNDAFGFCMGHLEERGEKALPVIDLMFRWTGAMFSDFGEIYREAYFDDTLPQQEVVTAAEVDFRTVKEFLFYLREKRGFNIVHVSFDAWNTVEYKQALKSRDIRCSQFTIKKPHYDELKSLIYQKQLLYYGNPIFINECRKLQLMHGNRVEAPRSSEGEGSNLDSHKDVADAVAGMAYRLSRLREGSVELAEVEDAESALNKLSQETDISIDSETLSENQKQLFREFIYD